MAPTRQVKLCRHNQPLTQNRAGNVYGRSMALRLLFALCVLFSSLPSLIGKDIYQDEAQRLADLMQWKPGSIVAEIGAGDGQMSFAAAERVGSGGHVYSTEIDEEKLSALREKVSDRKLQNITVMKAGALATNLPAGCCDAIFMRRVYHHFGQPAEMDASLFRSLKPGGLVAIIDFAPRGGLPKVEHAPSDHGGHGVPQDVLVQEMKHAGFEVISRLNDWPERDYCVVFRRPTETQ